MTAIARRVAYSIGLLFAISVLSFALLELAPGDFFAELQADTRVAPQTVDTLRAQYGLTQSPVVRYWQWLRSFVQGDLGFSLAHRAPVASVIWVRAANTLVLTVPAMVLTWCLALPLGVWVARRRNQWIDRVCSGVTSTLIALPDLLVALRRICRGTLILRTSTIPEVSGLPNAAVYFPMLTARGRELWNLKSLGVLHQAGISAEFSARDGYGNWFWGLTPSCLESLLKTAGFRVDVRATEAFAQTVVCTAVESPLDHRLPTDEEARAMGSEISSARIAKPA